MKLEDLAISTVSKRNAGSFMLYELAFPSGSDAKLIEKVVSSMLVGSELSAVDPTNSDCSFEVKKQEDAISIKRGCHGAAGTWRNVSLHQAVEWLLPAIEHSIQKPGAIGHPQLAIPQGANDA